MRLLKILLMFTICICGSLSQNDDCSAQKQPRVIKIGEANYLMFHLKTYNGKPPKKLRYFNGDIYYKSEDNIYEYDNDKINDKIVKYNIMINMQNNYVDNFGNWVSNKNKMTYVFDKKFNRKVKVITENGIATDYLTVDMDKNRIFLIGYDIFGENDKGDLYSFETTNLNIIGNVMKISKVNNIDNKISAIAIDSSNGNLVIAIFEDSDKWSLNRMETVEAEMCKKQQESNIYKKTLTAAMKIAGEDLIKLYEDAVLGKKDSEILNRNKLTVYPNGGSVKPILNRDISINSINNIDSDYNVCGTLFDNMSKEITRLKSDIEIVKEKYNKLYERVYSSEIIKQLETFNISLNNLTFTPLNITNVTKENVTCYNNLDNSNINNIIDGTKAIIKKNIDWFIYLKTSTTNLNS